MKRKLDIAKLNPEEEDEIMKFEEELSAKKEQVQQQMIAEKSGQAAEVPTEQPTPMPDQIMQPQNQPVLA